MVSNSNLDKLSDLVLKEPYTKQKKDFLGQILVSILIVGLSYGARNVLSTLDG